MLMGFIMRKRISGIVVALSFLASQGVFACLDFNANGWGGGWHARSDFDTPQEAVANCRQYYRSFNYNYAKQVKSNPDASYFKRHVVYCTGHVEMGGHPRYPNFYAAETRSYAVVNWADVILPFLDDFDFPGAGRESDDGANQGEANCIRDCYVGDGVNSVAGNVYKASNTLPIEGGGASSYNSLSGGWESALTQRVSIDDSVSPPVMTYKDRFGRSHRVWGYHDLWECSEQNISAQRDPVSGKTTVDLFDRIIDFLADGRVGSVTNRASQATASFNWDDSNSSVSVTSSHGGGYKANLSSSGRVESIVSEHEGISTSEVEYVWNDTTGNLLTETSFGRVKQYHYEDARFPSALTGITNEKGHREVTWGYDDQKRPVSSVRHGANDEDVESTSLDYSNNSEASPFTRVTNSFGKVTDHYYNDFSGRKLVTQVVGSPSLQTSQAIKSFGYSTSGDLLNELDSLGNETRYEYDGKGREVKRIEAYGTSDVRIIETVWNNLHGKPERIVYRGEKVIHFEYFSSGTLKNKRVEKHVN